MSKYIIFVLFLFSFIVSDIYSQTIEDEIKNVRSKYLKVNGEIKSYKKVDFIDVGLYKDLEPKRYSMEGAKIYNLAVINCYRYFKGNGLRKIVATFDAQHDLQTSEYYVWNGKLFFIFKKNINFLKPRGSKNITEKDKVVTENRYYIKDNKLIRWLDERKQKVIDVKKLKAEEEILIHDYKLYLSVNQNDTDQ